MLLSIALVLAQVAVTDPAPVKPVPTGPMVSIETSLGKVKVVLYQDKSPLSVKNFLDYVHAGHYDGTIFHRVIPGFMIQGGGMEVDMTERPTRPPVRNEARNGLRNSRGTLAMARTSDPNSATAQFFINVKDNPSLDFGIGGAGYAVFGEVVEGMDVVDKIVAVPTTSKSHFRDVPVTPVLMLKVRELASPKPAAPKPAPKTTPAPAPKP